MDVPRTAALLVHLHTRAARAQEFHAAFDLGANDRVIDTVDASGVLVAAVQALHARLQKLEARNSVVERDHASLRRRLNALGRTNRTTRQHATKMSD